jgi:hypothetical protein
MNWKSLVGPLADYAVAWVDANPAVIEAKIASMEGQATAMLASSLKSMPKPKNGLLGLMEGELDSMLEGYASQVVAQYGSAAIFALLDNELHTWAKALGG